MNEHPIVGIPLRVAAARTGMTIKQLRGYQHRDAVRWSVAGKRIVIHPDDVAALEAERWRGRPYVGQSPDFRRQNGAIPIPWNQSYAIAAGGSPFSPAGETLPSSSLLSTPPAGESASIATGGIKIDQHCRETAVGPESGATG